MVAPGDVDEELEVETKEECQKYGEVNKVVIFEVSDYYSYSVYLSSIKIIV